MERNRHRNSFSISSFLWLTSGMVFLGLFVFLTTSDTIFGSKTRGTNSLGVAASAKAFFGAALGLPGLNDSGTTQVVRSYGFSMITPENELKMDATQPTSIGYSFSSADKLVAFAKNASLVLHGHVLVWHNQVPNWVYTGGYTSDQLTTILKNRISTVLVHYPAGSSAGQFYSWDVVNEALQEDQSTTAVSLGGYLLRPYATTCNGSPCTNIWAKINYSGYPDYVHWAFAQARAADPNHTIKLYYNDFSIEPWSFVKSKAAFNLVKSLHDKGLIDGVGLQTHIATSWVNPSTYPTDVENTILQYLGSGIDVAISEMDVATNATNLDPTTSASIQRQLYSAISNICAKYSTPINSTGATCRRFTTWGVTDKLSWLGSSAAPLLFGVNYQPKQAYFDVKTALGISTTLDVTSPTASITSPTTGSSFPRRSKVTITATASDNVGVSKVEFLANGSNICTSSTAPYSCIWSVPGKRGSVTLTAKAYDAAGNIGTNSIGVTVY